MSVVFRLESPYRGEYLLHRITFGAGDPVVSLVAGIHGNEANGIYALNLLAGMLRLQAPRGTVHLLPCVNTFGAEAGQKRWPFDARDLNDAFPGRADGPPVERVAAAVVAATAGSVGIELQTGSASVHELPHARVPLSGAGLQLGRAAGLPVTWRRSSDKFDEGLVGAWRSAGQAALVLRGGRGGALDVEDGRVLARGLVRVLSELGVVHHGEPAGDSVVTTEVFDHRTAAGGFFVPEVRPGDRVQAGQLLGVVRAPLGGTVVEEIASTSPGTVLAVRVYPVVHARELVVRVAGPS